MEFIKSIECNTNKFNIDIQLIRNRAIPLIGSFPTLLSNTQSNSRLSLLNKICKTFIKNRQTSFSQKLTKATSQLP